LTDFGIAKMLTPSVFQSSSGQMGTPYYMAPEQKTDAAHVDKRADIYAVGVVLFELLTLENTIGFELPSQINKSLPSEIDEIVKKALATRPGDRYARIEDFSHSLNEVIFSIESLRKKKTFPGKVSEKEQEKPISKQPETMKISYRSKYPMGIILGALIVLAVVGTTFYFWKTAPSKPGINSKLSLTSEAKKDSSPSGQAESSKAPPSETIVVKGGDSQVNRQVPKTESPIALPQPKPSTGTNKSVNEKRKISPSDKPSQADSRKKELPDVQVAAMDNKMIRAKGIGLEPTDPNLNPAAKELSTKRAAKLTALRNLAEQVYGLKVEGETTIKESMTKSDEIKTSVNAFIQGARVVSEKRLSNGSYEVEVELDPESLKKAVHK
jgi:serine/threonine protein kinase